MNISEVIAVTELIFHYTTGEASLPVYFFYIDFNTFFRGFKERGFALPARVTCGYFF
jgi:hypothetical protein